MSSDATKPTVPAWLGLPIILAGFIGLLIVKPDPGARFRQSKEDTHLALAKAMSPLPTVPKSPDNPYADEPAVAELGQALFFDQGLSSNGKVSCATCHQPERHFTDGLKRAVGVGTDDRNTPTVVGAQYNRWWFWDGRSDSQWAQALGPLESPIEHDLTRTMVFRRVVSAHAERYTKAFGEAPPAAVSADVSDAAMPHGDEKAKAEWAKLSLNEQTQINRVMVRVGQALEAYQRQLIPGKAPIDRYIAALNTGDASGGGALSTSEINGLRLFTGKAKCVLCHSGPLFTDHSFHNLGLPSMLSSVPCATEREVQTDMGPLIKWDTSKCGPEVGRSHGAQDVLSNEFRCGGVFSDQKDCRQLRHLNPEFADFVGAFKTPTLRDVARTAPYMHTGEFDTLDEVLSFYNTMPGELRMGHRELFLKPLHLSIEELLDLKRFLLALNGEQPPKHLVQVLDPR